MERSAFIVLSLLATIAFMVVGCGGKDAPAASTSNLVEIGAGLQGPEGLTATVYASGLPKVSAFAFDAEGRLWAATADFSDVGEDGVYLVSIAGATPVKVIAGVHTPLGLLWYNGELYVSSKERVDAYAGFDGARFTQQRSVVLLPAGVGENNGIVMSPEGRIVLGISAPCDACVPESEFSGAVVSFLPDGSEVRVDASNIRAPIGLAYYPGTSDLFVTMNQRDDLGAATPGDWLALVHEGDDWGFPDCYGQAGSACNGAPTATAELDAHAAVSGVAIVTGQLGTTVGNSAIVAEWATGKLLCVALVKDGSGYKGAVEPFVTGLKSPVPVVLAPDGSLLVGDWATGTVYRLAAS